MTPLELREKGYQALVSQLGQMDAIRFLQQVGWGCGDYTQKKKGGTGFCVAGGVLARLAED